jgi:hypothetical protein
MNIFLYLLFYIFNIFIISINYSSILYYVYNYFYLICEIVLVGTIILFSSELRNKKLKGIKGTSGTAIIIKLYKWLKINERIQIILQIADLIPQMVQMILKALMIIVKVKQMILNKLFHLIFNMLKKTYIKKYKLKN